jgi:hypothetical protein
MQNNGSTEEAHSRRRTFGSQDDPGLEAGPLPTEHLPPFQQVHTESKEILDMITKSTVTTAHLKTTWTTWAPYPCHPLHLSLSQLTMGTSHLSIMK